VSVALLYNIPRSQSDLNEWTFSNAASHQLIVDALRAKRNARHLSIYVLDPLPQTDYGSFLLRHQFMHNQMDNILHIGGNDFTGINFDDPSEAEFIWFLHANEHILAHKKLGING